MKVVDSILSQVQECIKNDTFKDLETEKIELKDLSGGDEWRELYKTTCAFLNTNGGIIIIGIKENSAQNKYFFSGFNTDNESKLKELPKQFTTDNGSPIDLTEYVR